MDKMTTVPSDEVLAEILDRLEVIHSDQVDGIQLSDRQVRQALRILTMLDRIRIADICNRRDAKVPLKEVGRLWRIADSTVSVISIKHRRWRLAKK